MIPDYLYQTVYLCIVSIFTVVVFIKYFNRNGLHEGVRHAPSDVMAILLTITLILYIGFRPLSFKYFGDMSVYVDWYGDFVGTIFQFDRFAENKIFDNLIAYWGASNFGYTSFFVLIATIYFGAAYIGIKKLFPNNALAAYLVFLAAFSTFSYATNGIKAGAAAALFILALGYRQNLKVCIPLILLSWGFHHSMIMVVGAFVLTLFVKNPKVYFAGWVFCFLMAAAHVSFFAEFFSGFTTEHGASYLLTEGGNEGTKGGFRIDFILYSSMPVLVGWYAIFKRKLQLSQLYKNLLNLYLSLNGIWMLCMYANFTNRIAYLSWFLYPIVLIYPFLQEDWGRNKYKTFGKVMLLHLGFTWFMQIIYY